MGKALQRVELAAGHKRAGAHSATSPEGTDMKIIFHHIAKTAGTSLVEVMEKAFPGRVCAARYDQELTPEIMKDERFVFYQGHFSFEKIRQFKDANAGAFAFVFLRHPVNRVLSQYHNWVDAERTRREYAAIRARGAMSAEAVARTLEKFEQSIFGLSMQQFVGSSDPDIVDVVYNHQTRYLSRRTTFAANPLAGCVEAIENLSNCYDFAGLMETYDASLRDLFRRLNLDPSALPTGVRANTNESGKVGGRYRVEARVLTALVEKNAHDLSVFHYVLGKNLPDGRRHDLGMLALPVVF
jgi:hypothetical protein